MVNGDEICPVFRLHLRWRWSLCRFVLLFAPAPRQQTEAQSCCGNYRVLHALTSRQQEFITKQIPVSPEKSQVLESLVPKLCSTFDRSRDPDGQSNRSAHIARVVLKQTPQVQGEFAKRRHFSSPWLRRLANFASLPHMLRPITGLVHTASNPGVGGQSHSQLPASMLLKASGLEGSETCIFRSRDYPLSGTEAIKLSL